MIYNPALDGLRAIAVIIVVAFHSGAPLAMGGYLGVDVFFVLSGFLITSLLSKNIQKSGRVALTAFYARRLLRLYPTLALMTVAFLVAAPYFWPEIPRWEYAAYAATYISDYTRAFWDAPTVIGHTWSLSAEWHFYLIWPLVLPLILKSKSPAKTLFFCYVLATIWRIVNFEVFGWQQAYFRFDTRLSGLMLGGVLAMAALPSPSRWLVGLSAAVLIATPILPSYHSSYGLSWLLVPVELATAVLITACLKGGRFADGMSVGWLAYIGRLSYGVYLWHFPVAVWYRDSHPWDVTLCIALTFSLIMAAITYHTVDARLARWRKAISVGRRHHPMTI